MIEGDREAILGRLNFEAFYRGELGKLKPARGDEVLALCPFHEDTNPSLSVNLKTGLYNCFACGAKGDVFSFYMQKHAVDFKAAMDGLGRQAGVERRTSGPGLSLAEFASKKKLPLERLPAWGVTEGVGKGQKPLVIFSYRDLHGQEVGDSVRFRFAMADKPKSKTGGKPMLYGLWRLAEFRSQGDELIIFEGESDTLTSWLYDLPAVGVPGKTLLKTIQKSYLKGFQTIYVWQEPGAEDFPAGIAKKFPDHVVKALIPPDGLKDISEAHCRGDDVPVLLAQLKESAALVKPPPPPPLELGINLTDLGNAKRLALFHGQDLRYCSLSKKWYVWNGRCWQIDHCGETERRVQDVIARLYGEAKLCGDTNERRQIAAFALKCEAVNRILAVVRLAQSQPGLQATPAQFDANPWLLNCQNGTIDLRTGKLREHRREDLLTCMALVDYNPDATCDLWESFLMQIMDYKQRPDTALRMTKFLWQALGYSLTGDCREECLFLLWGGGANGKSTMVNTISAILGDYSRNTAVETLLTKKESQISNDIARLDGPRYVTCSEVDRGRRLAESLVKALTGRDTISARFLYGENFDYIPQFKLWLSTNNKPVIKGADDAIWRRIMFIKFPVHIPKQERDMELKEKLMAEAPGIFCWLIRGALDWYKHGLEVPPEVTTDIAEYRSEMDELADWLAECCYVDPTVWATASELYESYLDWAKENGVKEKQQLKQRSFGSCLAERGLIRDKGAQGRRIWRGIGLRSIEV